MRKHDSNMSTSFKFSQNQSLPRNNMQYASICIISHRYSPSKIRQFGSWGPKPWGDFARENGKNLLRSKNIPRTPPVIIPCNDLPFLDICLCSSPYYPNTIISWINHHISIYIYTYPIWSLAICSFVRYLVPLCSRTAARELGIRIRASPGWSPPSKPSRRRKTSPWQTRRQKSSRKSRFGWLMVINGTKMTWISGD